MKVSWNWISKYAELEGIDPIELSRQFTLSVAEIDEVYKTGEGLDNCFVVRVDRVETHPGSNKLKLATVSGGTINRTVVCGAPNVREGMITVLADEGSVVKSSSSEPFVIGKAVIRGVESTGMLASPMELGLGDNHAGIIELPPETETGKRFHEVAPVKDVIWEIDNKSLTHRPDLWGHSGIAREVASLCGRKYLPVSPDIVFTDDDPLTVKNSATDLCPRYTAFTMSGISIGPSPLWIQILLYNTGMRPINNVVDFTNYSMLTTGNPLHAFDRRDIHNSYIEIRTAKEGENIITLDQTDVKLNTSDLLITDSEGGIALAGVMGGLNSEVKDDTADIVLEAANFHAGTIRKTAVRAGIRTESSARFEKSLDPEMAQITGYLFARLVLDYIPGAGVSSKFYDEGNWKREPVIISISCDFIRNALGLEIANEKIISILTSLDFAVSEDRGNLIVRVPSWRATKDISIKEDLVEEIGRIYGYDNIPPQLPSVLLEKPWSLDVKNLQKIITDVMVLELGFTEVMNYSFDKLKYLKALGIGTENLLELANPVSKEEPVLKTDLIPNMLGNILLNENRCEQLRIFEMGRVFIQQQQDLPKQPRMFSFIIGDSQIKNQDDLFYNAKYCIETVIKRIERGNCEIKPCTTELPWIHPSKSADIIVSGEKTGYISMINPVAQKAMEIQMPFALCSINLDLLSSIQKSIHQFEPLPKFPAISYDVTVIVEPTVRAGEIIEILKEVEPELIHNVRCVDYFEGEKYAPKRALSFRMDFIHSSRTLKQEEVNEIHTQIVKKLSISVEGQVMT
ncbi:MAG: phenylalanine--tRNA ligase subunit beta [Deltaproteobacteria bacterium]|nr:phenylalanine--tRNA ligase subunit beta [Deltaproteobacteria bacterium]